ncbi:hypothetical protein [Nonomuraea typhae]|uniref:hypothetical protein n=1 Tax=Nonomuraea typhae TaxID=2603600 RepID=UPI0012FB4B04|nr:hypothetical protein [Nonomuraea typhae]
MSGREILATRLTYLEAAMKYIDETLNEVLVRRTWLHEVLGREQEAIDELARIGTTVREELKRDRGEFSELKSDVLKTSLRVLDDRIKQAKAASDEVRTLVEPAKFDQQDAHEKALRVECGKLRGEVRKLRARMDRGDDLHGIWQSYSTAIVDAAERIYDDYVAFIAGLAMRDANIAKDVSAASDLLLTKIPGQDRALTVPARSVACNLPGLVRMGFPEWTVWGVPLVGREAGTSFFQHSEAMAVRQLLDPPLEPEEELLAADAVAAYIIGPAYARAMFTLRLRPDAPEAETPSDLQRAEVILAVLELCSHKDGQSRFPDHVAELAALWDKLLEEFHLSPRPESRPPLAEKIFDALVTARIRGIRAISWEDVQTCAKQLRTGGRLPPLEKPSDLVVILLNAGWIARKDLKPDSVGEIAERMMKHLKPDNTARATERRSDQPLTTKPPRGQR